MDEREFRRLLNLFPVVRSRTYCQAEAASSSGTASTITEEKQTREVQNEGKADVEDPFWQKLKTEAERKYLLFQVGPNKAEQFVRAFRDAHEKLVYKKLSVDAAQSFISRARK
ncbi:Octanoyltransferase [Rhynchospora pubera]|uniref:Octanoyltransferase n=1 Tax=Rhynchospora pubera TaxID=906938 RepID=A0AAV8CHH2_9POAL|nr:Octanoyltransferase [Rhynchospora pubera]